MPDPPQAPVHLCPVQEHALLVAAEADAIAAADVLALASSLTYTCITFRRTPRSDTPPEDCPKHHLSTQHRSSGPPVSAEPWAANEPCATQYHAPDDKSMHLEGTVHGGVPCRTRTTRATPISFSSPRFHTPRDNDPPCNSPRTIISFPRLPAAAQPDASALPQPGYDAAWQSLDADAGSDVTADANSMPPHQLLARTASLAAAMPGSSGPHCSPRSFHEEFVGPSSLRARPAAQLRLRDGVLRATNPAFL